MEFFYPSHFASIVFKRLTIILIITVFPCIYCYSQPKKIYVDPENSNGLRAGTIFSTINIIPLQTTKESYFNNMADFLITPDRLIFTDNQTNSILIFDKQGKFLHRYKKKRYEIGPLQYIYAKNAVFFTSTNKNYTIPLFKKQQLIERAGAKDFSRYENIEMLHLDEKENYRIEKLHVPKYALQALRYFNGKYVMQYTRYNKYIKDTVLYHVNFIKDNEIVHSYFPFLNIPKLYTDYEDVYCNIDRTLNDSTFYIQRNYDNTIYKLINDSLQEAYRFVFPAALTMPADFSTTAFKNNIDFQNYKNKNGKAIRIFFNIVDMDHLLFFGISDNRWDSKRFVFNKKNSTLYDLSKITTDSSVHYLPAKIFSRLNNYDENYIYTYISSDDLLKEKQNILGKYKNEMPAILQKVFEGLTKFKNPIIIQLKVKPITTNK